MVKYKSINLKKCIIYIETIYLKVIDYIYNELLKTN